MAWPASGSAQVLNIRNYAHADGLPQIQVNALHQDRRGFVWLGTYGGLSRYDGRAFSTLTVDDGLTSNRIADLVELDDGSLVAGTVGGGVCFVVDGAVSRCLGPSEGLGDGVVNDLEVTANGDLWVATEAGLSLVRDARVVRTFRSEDGLPSSDVRQVTRDLEGRLLLITARGAAVLEEDRISQRGDSWSGDPPDLVRNTPAGLVVAFRGRLVRYPASGGSAVPIPGLPEGSVVSDAYDDGQGGVWLSSNAGALHWEPSGAVTRLTTANGLATNALNRVMVDREGSVWFATESGLDKFVPGPFALLDDGLSSNTIVRAVAEGPDGRIWVGTREGAAILEGTTFRRVPLPASVSDPRVYSLAPGPDGAMWVGTRDGLVRYAPDGLPRSVYRAELPDPYVSALEPDGSTMWVGTADGLARWDGGVIRRIEAAELDGVFVVTTAIGGDGSLWIGRRAGGVTVFDGASARTLGAEQGLTDQTIWSLEPDAGGAMWVGTNGEGAYRIGPDGIAHYTGRNGLVDDFVWQVLAAEDGSVWMFTSLGLDRLVGDELTHYGPAQGLIDPEGSATAALEDSRHRPWFGSASGLYRYDPDFVSSPAPPPPIYVDAIRAGGMVFPTRGGRIPPRAGVLTVRFAAPSFRDETSIRFSYRLPEVSREWSAPAAEDMVSLAGLAPGRHTLEVIALARDGRQSETPAVATFTVVPTFFQSWWFRGLLLVLAGVSVAGFLQHRTHRLEADRRRLEQLVNERTKELQKQTERVRREAEERERLQVQLNQAQKMEAVGQLAGGIAHDFNNLLTVIIGHGQLLEAELGLPDSAREDVDRVLSAAQRGATLVAQLLAFSRRQMIHTERLDLNISADRSVRFLKRLIGADVSLSVAAASRPAWIVADETQIDQMLINLALNAADAMPDGGTLEIRIDHTTVAAPLLGAVPDEVPPGAYVTLRVSDTGRGMDRETLERAFEPFFTTKERGRGTGLGLSTVYGMVHQCDGFVQATSEVGKGSEFRIFMPEADADPPDAPEPHSPTDSADLISSAG